MPPQEGISVTHFLTVDDIQRSVEFYAEGVRRPHSEGQRRQQRRAGICPDWQHYG